MRKLLYICTAGDYDYTYLGKILLSSLHRFDRDFDIIWFMDKPVEIDIPYPNVVFKTMPKSNVTIPNEKHPERYQAWGMKCQALIEIQKMDKWDLVLYLDVDMIVQSSLNELFDTDMADNDALAVFHYDSLNEGMMLFKMANLPELPDYDQYIKDVVIPKYAAFDVYDIIYADSEWIKYGLDLKWMLVHDTDWNYINKQHHADIITNELYRRRAEQRNAKIVHYTHRSKPWEFLTLSRQHLQVSVEPLRKVLRTLDDLPDVYKAVLELNGKIYE